MKRNSIKKITSTLLAMLLVCGLSLTGYAEDAQETAVPRSAFSLSGNVVAGESVSWVAPYGGKLLDYTVRVGDIVEPAEALFEIETTKVYAPCDGTVGGVRAQPGDEAAFIQEQYGALMYLEPDTLLQIDTSTAEAYNRNENKLVHVGETVYVQSVNSKSRTGIGYVTQVDGTKFSIEITEGNLRVAERANICRSENYEYESRIGAGKTARLSPVAITGEGSVLRVLVAEGAHVERGDVLAETVSGVLPDYAALPKAQAATGPCIVASIEAQPGAQVTSGQVLATLHPVSSLQIAADLNELDLPLIHVGDAVRVEWIGFKEQSLLEGTVKAISALSSTDSGDAEYTVYVDFLADSYVREGMSATIYLAE